MNTLTMNMEEKDINETYTLKHENENNNNVLDMLRNIACKWRMHHLRLAADFAFEAFEAPSAASRFFGGGFFRVDATLPIPAACCPG